MSKPVSIFSDYSQDENRVTNYVLLILRMLYEDSPRYLNELFSQLFPDEVGNVIGVSFNQQLKAGSGIPDGIITQKALSIFVETKIKENFNEKQLARHLAGLSKKESGVKVLVLLGDIETDLEHKFEDLREKYSDQYKNEIHFVVISFEMLLSALSNLQLSKSLTDSIRELEFFFDERGLLPRWKYMLDVVNCTGSIEEVIKYGIYTCPASGGAYSHRRCKYFGAYGGNKVVENIFEIRAVLDYEDGNCAEIIWNNSSEGKDELGAAGLTKLKAVGKADNSIRLFLLGPRYETRFAKDTRGGMYNSKRYFDISNIESVDDAMKLADELRSRTWSDLK